MFCARLIFAIGPYRLAVRTPGSHPGNRGSIPLGITQKKKLTEDSENFNQKYFRLHKPIVIPAQDGVPETTYEFLYIRKPDPYRHHVGDIDFYLEETEYQKIKQSLEAGQVLPGARIFPGPHLDMIELYHPDSDVLAYVSTEMMTDLVKTTKSGG